MSRPILYVLLWGGDVKKFHAPVGRFDGIIGGPPCQAFSSLRHLVRATGGKIAENLIPEYERVCGEAAPSWFVMENVPDAPEPIVPGYVVRSLLLNNRWFPDEPGSSVGAEQNRERRFSFGTRDGRTLKPHAALFEAPRKTLAAMASGGGREVPVAIGGSGKRKRRLLPEHPRADSTSGARLVGRRSSQGRREGRAHSQDPHDAPRPDPGRRGCEPRPLVHDAPPGRRGWASRERHESARASRDRHGERDHVGSREEAPSLVALGGLLPRGVPTPGAPRGLRPPALQDRGEDPRRRQRRSVPARSSRRTSCARGHGRRALMKCICPDLDAVSCYRNRHKLDPGDGEHFLDEACECICHAEAREDERYEEDAHA